MHYILEQMTHEIRKKYEVKQDPRKLRIHFICDEKQLDDTLYHRLLFIVDAIIIKFQMDVDFPCDCCECEMEPSLMFFPYVTVDFNRVCDYIKFCEELIKLELIEDEDESEED
jgi:hypothetical protein